MRRRRSQKCLILAFLTLILLLSVRLFGGQPTRNQPALKQTQSSNATQGPEKTGATKQIGDAALTQTIDGLLDENDRRQARFGVFVMSLKDGRVLYSRDADRLFTPASNMKVYT